MIAGIKKQIVLSVLFITTVGINSKAQTPVVVSPLVIAIDGNSPAQVIENFGASGCWYAESIGKYWPKRKKEKIAALLFSRTLDKNGNPTGIGLSAWRFNIGGGTAEQRIAGGIKDPQHRVECFLDKAGNYDWKKQSGYQWFLKKAKGYDVNQLIAFVNTPPVQFTKNGLGYKTDKDYLSNLKSEQYGGYANFLTEVIKHFDKEKLHFNFISPVNEPQWDWTGKQGEAKQEGSPWTNAEIYRIVKSLDSSLTAKKLSTKIITTEAGMLSFLTGNNTAGSRQIQQLFADTSVLTIGHLKSVPRTIAAHSYFTDYNDTAIINTRGNLADTAKKYKVNFWQSEYSMLGNGYKESSKEKRTPMDCALFLAKIIHTDLTVANATAWQFWNAFEPGNASFDTRYFLIALKPDSNFKNGDFTPTKNLWALGHFSLFIRPGMQRLPILRSDNMGAIEAAQNILVSAYKNTTGRVVVVFINYSIKQRTTKILLPQLKVTDNIKAYLTTAAVLDNMRPIIIKDIENEIILPARSILTLVIN